MGGESRCFWGGFWAFWGVFLGPLFPISPPPPPGPEEAGLLSLKHLYEVAAARWEADEELRRGGGSLRHLVAAVLGSARSLGIRVEPR